MAKNASKRKEPARERVSVEVSSSSVKLELDGSSAISTGLALIDMLSPFTNTAGYIGDRIADLRRTAAIRAAAKAVDLLKEEGITKGNVPPKILLPWLDGASLETDNDSRLEDLWAGLFSRSVKSSDAANISYIETLKKIGKEEAELLDFFVGDRAPFASDTFYDFKPISLFSDQNPLADKVVQDIERITEENKSIDDVRKEMNNFGMQGMCQVIFFSINDSVPYSTPYFEKNEQSVSNLKHLGLISIEQKEFEGKFGRCVITWFQVTKYAFDFIWACHGVVTGRQNRRQADE